MFEILNSKYFFIAIVMMLITLLMVSSFFYIKKNFKKIKNTGVYKRKQFLTKNEQDCLKHLIKEFPDYMISMQVSMGAILEPIMDGYSNNPDVRTQAAILRNKIGSKIIDFVFIDKNTLDVSFIIELDDKSHDNKIMEDKERDEHLLLVGIPTARFRRENGTFPSRSVILKKLKR